MNKPPVWFYAVAVLALLWNLAGLMAVVSDFRMSAADVAALTPEQQALRSAVPGWAVAGSALAVVGGTLGCLLLLLRQRWAVAAFIASLVGLVLQDAGIFGVAGAASGGNLVPMVLQGVVAVIAIALLLLARRSLARGWLK